jgi:3-oxoacyl-[acyl-carrier protein] reductase
MDLGIAGRFALVTGSSRGTGRAIAGALAREGAVVFVHGISEGDAAVVAEELGRQGTPAHAVTGDLATDAGADQVRDAVGLVRDGVDILVNNYGVPAGGRWGDVTPADWVDIFQRNTLSAVRMIDRFVPAMKTRGWGRVVQVATIGTARPNARMPHYYASKAALANLTASLAKELSGSGVTVNTVSPGLIHTPELEAYFRHRAVKRGWGDDWARIEAEGVREMMPNPLGRMARTDEVADLVAFLVSERGGYINGVEYRIDGGATIT